MIRSGLCGVGVSVIAVGTPRSLYSMIRWVLLVNITVAVCGTGGLSVPACALGEEAGLGRSVFSIVGPGEADGDTVGSDSRTTNASFFSTTRNAMAQSEISMKVARRATEVNKNLRLVEGGSAPSGSIKSSSMPGLPATIQFAVPR